MACDITGYSQKELQGKNVKLLIPRPFSDQHDQYVMKHVTTGVTNILDTDAEFVVLHKERYVIGVSIYITKISGFGMDSVFMVSPLGCSFVCTVSSSHLHTFRGCSTCCPRLPTLLAPG